MIGGSMYTVLRVDHAEALCKAIIDTLVELKSSSRPITPGVLHQELIQKQVYMKFLTEIGLAKDSIARPSESGEEIQEKKLASGTNGSLEQTHVKMLQDFRLNLLGAFEDNLTPELLERASEIRELIRTSNRVEQILGLNDDILDTLRAATLKVNGDIEEFTTLVKEISQDLVEIESGLMSSFLCTRETYDYNKAFNNTLTQNLGGIGESINKTTNMTELKEFVVSRLSMIKKALDQKREMDDLQLKKSAGEVSKLKRRIGSMKQEIIAIQQKASVLEEETLLDPLTGVSNRRAYEKRIQEELARFDRHKDVFSIIMIDIDYFKSVNDRYGHLVGDGCLKELTGVIKKILRGTDFLARYGGEEFVAILPGTDDHGLSIVAGRLCRLIERARFMNQNEEIPLTVSVGGTCVRPSDRTPEEIFRRVDMAMYEAKANGRNRSIIR
jgi:diguanylate cyclase